MNKKLNRINQMKKLIKKLINIQLNKSIKNELKWINQINQMNKSIKQKMNE